MLAQPQRSLSVSVIIETDSVGPTIRPLLAELSQAMVLRGWTWEALVVPARAADAFPETARQHDQLRFSHPCARVLDIAEHPAPREANLLSALSLARFDHCVVIDATQAKTGKLATTLINALVAQNADVALGVLAPPTGVAAGRSAHSAPRRLVNALARPLGTAEIPDAGPFAIRRQVLDSNPTVRSFGPNLPLDLIVQCKAKQVVKVAVDRPATTNASSRRLARFEQLSRLYDFACPKAAARAKFVFTAAAGAAICLAVVGLVHGYLGYNFPFAMAIGLVAMIATTFLVFARYVHARSGLLATDRPYGEFVEMSLAEFFAGWMFACLTNSDLAAVRAIIGIAVLLLVRYAARKVFRHDQRGIHADPRPVASFRVAFPGQASAASA